MTSRGAKLVQLALNKILSEQNEEAKGMLSSTKPEEETVERVRKKVLTEKTEQVSKMPPLTKSQKKTDCGKKLKCQLGDVYFNSRTDHQIDPKFKIRRRLNFNQSSSTEAQKNIEHNKRFNPSIRVMKENILTKFVIGTTYSLQSVKSIDLECSNLIKTEIFDVAGHNSLSDLTELHATINSKIVLRAESFETESYVPEVELFDKDSKSTLLNVAEIIQCETTLPVQLHETNENMTTSNYVPSKSDRGISSVLFISNNVAS